MAIPATAKRPAATEPMFFVAAPVKVEPGAPAPVLDGAKGVMGDPVGVLLEPPVAAPDPEEAAVPVATGAVPVANPVEPAIAVELRTTISWTHRQMF